MSVPIGPSVPLYETASVTVGEDGAAVLRFGPARIDRVWQGTSVVFGAPQGTEFAVTVGGLPFGFLYSPGPSGPWQLLNGQTLELAATGLTPGLALNAMLAGVNDPGEAPSPYTGPTIVTSVAGVP